MNPSLFLLVLRARFGLFALAVCATLISAAVVTLILPKTYRATASLVIDEQDAQTLNGRSTAFLSAAERTSYMQTQVEILRSPNVARKVIDALNLAQRPDLRALHESSRSDQPIEEWLALGLPSELEVETSQSNVLHVSYNSPDAADAAAIANGFAQAYMDTTIELRVAPTRQAAEWFDEQLKTLRNDLEEAQRQLTAYQREHGIVTTGEGEDEEYMMLSNLSDQMVRAMQENIDLATREDLARRALGSGASLDSLPTMRDDSGLQELRAELRQGEAELQALSVKFGENHPDYRRQRAQNAYLRQQLNSEMQKVAQLESGRRQESEQRAARMSAALAAQRARLLDQKQDRDGLAVLVRNVNTAQTAYETAMQRYVANQVESRTNHANATLLTAAAIPRVPHSPNVLLNMGLAGIVGILLGLGLVMTREMTDRRVHSPLELAEATGAPVLGELIAWNPAGRLALAAPRNPLRSLTHRRQEHP
jgi:chain length determinant protein EpsF